MTERAVTLPLPPSMNNLFGNQPRFLRGIKNGGGRYKMPAYKAWLTEAGFMLKIEPKWRVPGHIRLSLFLPAKMRGDASNRIKVVEDLLVKHGRIDDDRNVVELRVTKTWADPATCRVVVEPVP